MIEYLKLKSPPSVGTRGDSRGATQVNACSTKQKTLCDATGKGSQRHSFQVRSLARRIPSLYNGSSRIGLLNLVRELPNPTRSPVQLGGPFGFCAFALLSPCGHSRPRARLSGNRFEAYSSSSAYLCYWALFYDGGGQMSRGNPGYTRFNF